MEQIIPATNLSNRNNAFQHRLSKEEEDSLFAVLDEREKSSEWITFEEFTKKLRDAGILLVR